MKRCSHPHCSFSSLEQSLYCVRSVILITERVVFSRAHENYTHTTCFVLDLLLGKKFCSELQSILLQLRSGLLSKISLTGHSLQPLRSATPLRNTPAGTEHVIALVRSPAPYSHGQWFRSSGPVNNHFATSRSLRSTKNLSLRFILSLSVD